MTVTVKDRICGHEFELGQQVEIIEEQPYAYKCKSLSSEWWLIEDEFERGNEELLESGSWSGGFAPSH